MNQPLNGAAAPAPATALTPRQVGEQLAKNWAAALEQAGISAGHFVMDATLDGLGTVVLGILTEELHKRGYKVVSHALLPSGQPGIATVGMLIQTINGEPKRIVQL